MFRSLMHIPCIPQERLSRDNYYLRCPVTAIPLDRIHASQRTSEGPTSGDATFFPKELLSCVPPSKDEWSGPNRRACACNYFPLDTLEEPLAYNRFAPVPVVSGEPAETPKTRNVGGNQEKERFALMPVPDMREPSFVAAAVIDSSEPQQAGQRGRTTPSISPNSPHKTQWATTPRRNSKQEELCSEKTGSEYPAVTQESAQKDVKQRRQKPGDESSRRQRLTAKQSQRDRLRAQQLEQQQQQGCKGNEQYGNRSEHQEQKQQSQPLEMHRHHKDSPHQEECGRESLGMRRDSVSKDGEVGGNALQKQQRQMFPLDGNASSSAATRSQGTTFAGHCKKPVGGTQSRTGGQYLEDGEHQLLPLHNMPEEWLQHEMQALLREEYQQRQIVQRREEEQHEALQQHPPLERPWVLLAQKQQEEDLRHMHQEELQQMQQELINRHQRQLHARLQEKARAQQEKLEKARREAIHMKLQQKQNHQKQPKAQQPTGGSKPRSTPLIKRKSTNWQHRQPSEMQTKEEHNHEQREQQQQQQLQEERQTQNQQQHSQQDQHQSPTDGKGEDSRTAPAQEEQAHVQQQQLEEQQPRAITNEAETAKPNQRKKQREILQKHQQLSQIRQQEQQLQQQQQHVAPIHEEVRHPLELSEVTIPATSKHKVQQALQKGRKSACVQKSQEKQQLPTEQEGSPRKQSMGEREQTDARQPTTGERQKEQEELKQREDRTERNEKHRQKQKQQEPYQEAEQIKEHFTDWMELSVPRREEQLPANGGQNEKLTREEGRHNEQREGVNEEEPPLMREQPLSKEKQEIEQQQQPSVDEMKKGKGQTPAENPRIQTQPHKEQSKQRWLQQKEPQHPVPKGPQPQTPVQRMEEQRKQQLQVKQQRQQQEQVCQQQHEIYQQQGHQLEQQESQHEQLQPENNATMTRSELLRLSFTPLAAVNDNKYYLKQHLLSSTSSPLPHVPWGTTPSTQKQLAIRMSFSDTPNQPLRTTPHAGSHEGQRSGDTNSKAPMLPLQQADGRRFSKDQQCILRQRWTPLGAPQQQAADSKQAARGGPAKNIFRKRNPVFLPPPPPPPPPVAAFTQLTQHPQEQWKTTLVRGCQQAKNSRSRHRLLPQEQRRLQKQLKQPVFSLPLRATESSAGQQETQQNLRQQGAGLQQNVLQQQQQPQDCTQPKERDLRTPLSSKRGAKSSSKSSHSNAGGPDSLVPFAPCSRPTWVQNAIEFPTKREFRNSREHRAHEATGSFVEAGDVRTTLCRNDDKQAADECIDGRNRRRSEPEMWLTPQFPMVPDKRIRSEPQEQRLQDQTTEQQHRDRLNTTVVQVHQQLAHARLQFLEEQARAQSRSSRGQVMKEGMQQEEHQHRSYEQPAPKQEIQRHRNSQQQQLLYQHQPQQQQQEQHEKSKAFPYPLHQQQPICGPGHKQQHERQPQEETQQQQEQRHPYGGQQQQQQRGHTQQQPQPLVMIPYLSREDIQKPSQTQGSYQEQHPLQQQQLEQGIELPYEYRERLSAFQRQPFQQQDIWGQHRAWHPQQLQQQVWLHQHEQHEQQLQHEQLHLTQQQHGQQPPPPQQLFIYGKPYTARPQGSYPATPQQRPVVEQQQQQAWLQLQLHWSLQQQQHAWLLINQQRLRLFQQQHPWTPNQQHLWALQQQQFWQQQQQLWQLQQPHAWMQQQQNFWLQHQQQAYMQQQLLHQQPEQGRHQHGPLTHQRAEYFNPYTPACIVSDVILGSTENAANGRYIVPSGMRMPPPWDGCLSPENIRLGFCRACLQYVHLNRYLLPLIPITVAPSPAVVTGVEEAPGNFSKQEQHPEEFLSREQRLPTAPADAARGPPGFSLLPETTSEGAAGATDVHDGTYQQMSAAALPANDHITLNTHSSSSSFSDSGRAYNDYPTRNTNTSGSNGVYSNSSSSRASNTTQMNYHMNGARWEEGENNANNHGNGGMAGNFARFGIFEPFEVWTESPRGFPGEIDSMVPAAATASKGASMLQPTTTEACRNQLHQPLQHHLHEGPSLSGGLVVGVSTEPSHGSLNSFSFFNPSAPVFVPSCIAQPDSPTFAAAVAAAASAANQQPLTASTLGNPTMETQQWNTQQTNPQTPVNSPDHIYPGVVEQQNQSEQQLQQHKSQTKQPQQQQALQMQLPQAEAQYIFDGQSNVQQRQHSNQSLHQFPQSYQRLNPQQYQQHQEDEQQQNEQQQNEQQQPSQPGVQQHQQRSRFSFPSFISGSFSDCLSSLHSTSGSSLLVIGACLECWQFVVRPPALWLLDQIRARGIGGRIIFI
ncbi:hypothetical protein, conserved [Eimeria acervulina]|uniref:Uncharacterized protein n=1 Tax=Eimeria acervulina TaxID=5801 RepID=U6GMA4_EIMAC|nr:hypothetical protein, conserved [Eimeria acervulina]CDI79734.1 hypothetical protein, conserved [Eimeria acervulina]